MFDPTALTKLFASFWSKEVPQVASSSFFSSLWDTTDTTLPTNYTIYPQFYIIVIGVVLMAAGARSIFLATLDEGPRIIIGIVCLAFATFGLVWLLGQACFVGINDWGSPFRPLCSKVYSGHRF